MKIGLRGLIVASNGKLVIIKAIKYLFLAVVEQSLWLYYVVQLYDSSWFLDITCLYFVPFCSISTF